MRARKLLAVAAAVLVATLPAGLSARLANGAKAPKFATQGAMAGESFSFNLEQALKKGPVVLYFYPKAFTQGCTLEANAFAENMDEFTKAGATVVGMSADDLPTLKRFSKEECRDKFAVALASADTIKGYDVANATNPAMTTRTSYVIAPDGKVLMSYTDGNFAQHVTKAMETVKAWKEAKK